MRMPLAEAAVLPEGTDEEVAGPARQVEGAGPVAQAERISSMDVLRGFALMGILLIDILDFGMPEWNIDFPLATVQPVFHGPHWRVNTVLWFAVWVFAKGKMRALFSMLFGAGTILMTRRGEARGLGMRTADLWLRRSMWLVLLGTLHAHLIWRADILYFYGLAGLTVLLPCRHLRVRTLLVAGLLIVAASDVRWNVTVYRRLAVQRAAAAQARVAERAGAATAETRAAIARGDADEALVRPGDRALSEEIAEHRKGYWAQRRGEWGWVTGLETSRALPQEMDVAGMMLIGMGLFRAGFFSAKLRTRLYAMTAIAGFGVAWPLIFAGAWDARQHGFDLVRSLRDMYAMNGVGRLGGALGNAAVVMLAVKAGWMRWLMTRVARVGPDGADELSADERDDAVGVFVEPAALVWGARVLPAV